MLQIFLGKKPQQITISVLYCLGWLFHLTLLSELLRNIGIQFEWSLEVYSVVREWKSVQDAWVPPCLEKRVKLMDLHSKLFYSIDFLGERSTTVLQQTGSSLRAGVGWNKKAHQQKTQNLKTPQSPRATVVQSRRFRATQFLLMTYLCWLLTAVLHFRKNSGRVRKLLKKWLNLLSLHSLWEWNGNSINSEE